MKTHYKILGVNCKASSRYIDFKYYQKSKNNINDEMNFNYIDRQNQLDYSYGVIGNSYFRQAYDKFLVSTSYERMVGSAALIVTPIAILNIHGGGLGAVAISIFSGVTVLAMRAKLYEKNRRFELELAKRGLQKIKT